MPPKGHSILSASSSDRWLHCPPSARLCETYEDKISKLNLKMDGEWIANYDRGWDIEPTCEEAND